jgi:hypothetical protein
VPQSDVTATTSRILSHTDGADYLAVERGQMGGTPARCFG